MKLVKTLINHQKYRNILQRLFLFGLAFVGMTSLLNAQTLKNDWNFNEANGATTAVDSISASNITLNGAASFTGNGSLTLPGGAGNYAQIPDGILSTFTNSMTIETWFTENGAQTWSRIFTIGGNTAAATANTGNYIDLIPQAGGAGGYWTEFNHGSGARDAGQVIPADSDATRTPIVPGTGYYAAIVFDGPSQTARLYLNGVRVGAVVTGFKPADMGFTRFNWLGRDQYNDANFNGSIDEMHVWDGAVSQRYVSASAVAGAGVVINNLTPTSSSLTAGASLPLTEIESASVTVRLPQTGATDLDATADATNWISGNNSVLTVTSNGVIQAVGLGTTTVSAVIAGNSVTSGNITVTKQVLQHKWSFSEIGGATAADSVGGATINLLGTTSLGSGVLNLPGGSANYAKFPNGILQSNNSITIDTWLTDNGAQTWARAWSFGGNTVNADVLTTSHYYDFCPKDGGSKVRLEIRGNVDVPASTTYANIATAPNPVIGVEIYYTVTYNAQNQTCVVYSNGIVCGTLSGIPFTPAKMRNALNNYIGKDEYNDANFNGTIDEMRIWDGVLSGTYALASAAAGPSVLITNDTPVSLAVSVGSTSMTGSQTQQATVTGDFLQITGITLTSIATNWVSSNPSILTVSPSGLITAVSGGTATVSAMVNGVTGVSPLITVQSTAPTIVQGPVSQTNVLGDNVTFSVLALGGNLSYQWSLNAIPITAATNSTLLLTNISFVSAGTYSVLVSNSIATTNLFATLTVVSPTLQHEWSFNESSGTNAFDSIGNATITALGNSTLGSGVLSLPGGSGDYAQFPNGILSTYSNSITIESWFTDTGSLVWARAWSFGGDTSGPNNNKIGNNYIDLIPHASGSGLWNEFNHNGTNIHSILTTPLTVNIEQHVIVVYEVSSRTARTYVNGLQVMTLTNVLFTPSDMGFTYNNYIGNDQYNDPTFQGSMDEMRIWNGVVTPLYAQVSAAAGPGVVITNTTPQVVAISAINSVAVGQTQQAAVTANFLQITGVPIVGLATNWLSSNPAVLTVSTNGFISAISNGTATVSATLNGVSGSLLITVVPGAPIITKQPVDSVTLLVGGTLHTSVANIGSPPFTYFWITNGGSTPVSVSTSPSLTIPNLQVANSGSYVCIVSNQYGTVTSSTLNLTVVAPNTFQQAMLSLGPIAYWPLSENSGTVAYDVIGGYNGTYTGTYLLGQSGPTNDFFAGSTATLFDGASGHVDIPGTPLNITGAVTVVAWVNLISAGSFDGVFGRGDTSWRLDVTGAAVPGGNTGAAQSDAVGNTGINDGNWHMLAYSYTGITNQIGNGSLYVDGVLVANNTITATPAGNSLDAWIGGSPDYNNRFLPAFMANAAVFTQALTATQVQGIYNGVGVVPQTITIAKSGSNVVLTWQTGTLLEANSLLGPWATNSTATSGYTVPATNSTKFYKLLVSP